MYDVADGSTAGDFEVGSADKDYRQVESGEFSLRRNTFSNYLFW